MRCLALIPLLVFVGPAHSAASNWFETDGGRMRLVVEDGAARDGMLRGALEIQLQPGWKTYWRDPGDAGVPPQIDVGSATNVSSASLDFPPPHRFREAYGTWAGYQGRVSLPVLFRIPDTSQFSAIDADVFVGFCREVCVPVQARLSVVEPGADDTAIVDAAFAALPATADETLRIESIEDRGTALFASASRTGGDGTLFVVTPPGWRLGTPQPVDRDGARGFIIPIVARGAAGRIAFDYTLALPDRAVAGTVFLP